MKLLEKIIGKAPSEMSADELIVLTQRNRVRIRKEIKEYRKLKQAMKEVDGPKIIGRPRKTTVPKMKESLFVNEIKKQGLTADQINKMIAYLKEKQND
jgi:hypothetical protein